MTQKTTTETTLFEVQLDEGDSQYREDQPNVATYLATVVRDETGQIVSQTLEDVSVPKDLA